MKGWGEGKKVGERKKGGKKKEKSLATEILKKGFLKRAQIQKSSFLCYSASQSVNSEKVFLHVLHFSLREHKSEIEIGSQVVIGYPWPPILLFRGYPSNSISFSRQKKSHVGLRVQSVPDNGVFFPETFSGGFCMETEIKITVLQQDWARIFWFQN